MLNKSPKRKKRDVIEEAVCQFDYVPEKGKEKGKLAIKEGDVIQVTKRDPKGWWKGLKEQIIK